VHRDTPLVVGRCVNILRDTYSDTTSVKYTLSCTRPSKIVASGVGEPYLGTGGHLEWPKTWGVLYTKKQDKTTSGWVGNYNCERPTVASGDSLGPNIQQPFMSQTCTKGFGENMVAENFTSSINDINAKYVFSYVMEVLAIFFQCPFRSIQDLCKP